MKEIRCGRCRRLLARAKHFNELEVKCPRCNTLNHVRAESPVLERPRASHQEPLYVDQKV